MLFVVGVVVWAIGFAFESIGDWQLARFRADPDEQGRRSWTSGLWRFTRHPNYFGDATMWWGIWLVAAQQWQGAVTVLSPVLDDLDPHPQDRHAHAREGHGRPPARLPRVRGAHEQLLPVAPEAAPDLDVAA